MRDESSAIENAVHVLRGGGLVAFATETVYGLGADAESARGVASIYERKGRPADHPLIVHVASQASACYWANLGAVGCALAGAFWPGPLTLIALRNPSVARFACGKESTIGLRCPSHPLAQQLLHAFENSGGHGIAAPSANLFGRVSPTCAQHVREDFGEDLLVLDGGNAQIGLESTIVDISRGFASILRPGVIGPDQINDVLAARGLRLLDENRLPAQSAPKVSGSLAAHYAPRSPLTLTTSANLRASVAQLIANGRTVAVCSRDRPDGVVHWEQAADNPVDYGQRLYAMLRAFDQLPIDQIVVESPPSTPAWSAVLDRLQRAQTGSGR